MRGGWVRDLGFTTIYIYIYIKGFFFFFFFFFCNFRVIGSYPGQVSDFFFKNF